MITGCYTLDLYCDSPKHGPYGYKEFPAQFTDEFGSACRAEARRAGWKINRAACKAICPKCAGVSPKDSSEKEK